MANIKKIKKNAFALFVVVGLILLWYIINNVRMIVFKGMQWALPGITITIIGALIILAILTVALILLFSIKKGETPFNPKNVKRLKVIAILLALIEPYLFITEWVFNKYYPIVLSDNTTTTIHFSLGGCVLASGLVVYCIALIFEYGISLQKQADETL